MVLFKMKRSSIFLAIVFQYGSAYCQELPTCVNSLVSKIARQQKKNSCGGSDKLLRIEEYSYNGTLLYKLVFEKKNICPDYVSNTIFYGSDCQAKIQLLDGGLKYRHQVLPATVNEKEIKFIKNIDWEKSNPSQSSVDNTVQLKVDVNGNQLKTFFLGMNVENLWIAGSHINWETGLQINQKLHQAHIHIAALLLQPPARN